MFKKIGLILFSSSIFLTSVFARPLNKLNRDEVFLFGYFAGSISKSCVLYQQGILNKYETINSLKGTIKLLDDKENNSIKNNVKDYSLNGIKSGCWNLMMDVWY